MDSKPEFSGSAEMKVGGLTIRVSTSEGTSSAPIDRVAILKGRRDKILDELEKLNKEISDLGG